MSLYFCSTVQRHFSIQQSISKSKIVHRLLTYNLCETSHTRMGVFTLVVHTFHGVKHFKSWHTSSCVNLTFGQEGQMKRKSQASGPIGTNSTYYHLSAPESCWLHACPEHSVACIHFWPSAMGPMWVQVCAVLGWLYSINSVLQVLWNIKQSHITECHINLLNEPAHTRDWQNNRKL